MSGLISLDDLEARLGEPDLVLIEVSFYPPDKAAWHRGHIPGSHYAYWKDLCWDDTSREFPAPDVISARLGAFGATDDSLIVLIGDPIQFATYAYWVLAMTGFEDRVVVLDGGERGWRGRGMPLTSDDSPIVSTNGPSSGLAVENARVGRDDVLAHLGEEQRALLDLRSSEEFNGDRVAPVTAPIDHGAERAGRIPGATHLPHESLLDDDGLFLDGSGIEAVLASAGILQSSELVTYCRLSHRASLGWFALTRVGTRDDVKVYDGSWTEWGSMVGMPIER